MAEVPADLARFAESRRLTGLEPVGIGLEFAVFQAVTAEGARVALRTPVGDRFQSNANDPHVDTRSLLRWEREVTAHLSALGFPVATPRELVLGDPDVLVNTFLPDDGAPADQAELGGLLRRLHRLPLPPMRPIANEGLPTAEVLPRRMARRWREVAALVPDLPAIAPVEELTAVIAGSPADSLLHLDVRAANLRCVGGRVLGLLDWSNALVGDPQLELARLAEFALLPDNGIDFEAVLAAYGQPVALESPAFWIYRLDAALMLAVVFLSEAPDDELGRRAVDRLRQVHHKLAQTTM